MRRPVAILHGWSDDSSSFRPLAAFLERHGYRSVPLFLGDYVSLRDDVRIDDVAKRMEAVVAEARDRPPTHRGHLPARFDLVVHSTGGLVARRWISRYHADRACPVENLLMLAPANFGSKLAHIGRSMLGRVAKGWRTGLETGAEMLHALELGSPLQWDLAEDDLFVPDGRSARSVRTHYAPDRVRPFVIVGTHPYDRFAARLTNEHGSDGTVRVAAANLNARGMTVDFSGDPAHLTAPRVRRWPHRGGKDNRFPLAVLPDRDHSSVVHPEEPGYARQESDQRRLGTLILQALAVNTPTQYARVRADWEEVSLRTRRLAGRTPEAQADRDAFFRANGVPGDHFNEHFQIFVHAVDEYGEDIDDYFVSFMPKQRKGWFGLGRELPPEAVFFHDEVMADTHVHHRAPSRRSFFVDRYDLMRDGGFYDRVTRVEDRELRFTLTASDPGDRVAYFSRASHLRRGLVRLHQLRTPSRRWLRRHGTHFVRVVVPRAVKPEVFDLRRV